jgi:hypothetical protein
MEAGTLKRLYGALVEDQIANVDEIGRWQAGGELGIAGEANVAPSPNVKSREVQIKQIMQRTKKTRKQVEWELDNRGYVMPDMRDETPFTRARRMRGAPDAYPTAEPDGNIVPISGDPALGEKLRAANLIYAKERALGERIVDMYGADVQGSIANKMRTSMVSASKGDASALNKLIDFVPEDLRRETVATSLAQAARNTKGEFGFAEYAKLYPSLRANPPAYARIVKELGEGSDQVLRDLYEVSKRVTDARASVLTTGKANQILLQNMSADRLIGRIMRATVRVGATTGGAAVAGPVGAGVGSVLAESLTRGGRTGLQKAGKLFASPKFQALAEAAARGEMPNLDMIREVARSSAFDNFARAVKLPVKTQQREMWLLSALQGQIEEGVQQ